MIGFYLTIDITRRDFLERPVSKPGAKYSYNNGKVMLLCNMTSFYLPFVIKLLCLNIKEMEVDYIYLLYL